MNRPIPGKTYIVKKGDTLSGIAGMAYGDPLLFPRIFQANQSAVKSGDPDKIVPGEILFIPVLPEIEIIREKFFQSGRITDGVELKIEDRILPVSSARVIRTMDTIADMWTATIAWEPGIDKRLDELTKAYAMPKASISLDGELMVSGILYDVEQISDKNGRSKNLGGYSFTIDLVDSHPIKPPYEHKGGIKLEKRCENLLTPLGMGVELAPGLDTGGAFKDVKIKPTETIHKHLKGLSDQRSILLSSTPEGNLLLLRADLTSPSVGTLEEGKSLIADLSAKFQGRKRFSVYRALSKGSRWGVEKVGIAKDDEVSRVRCHTFIVDDAIKGEMNDIAAWRKNKKAAKSEIIKLPVTSWNAPNGKKWKANTRVTIKSITFDQPDGFNYLIKQVEYTFDNSGKNAILSLIDPKFYSKQLVV